MWKVFWKIVSNANANTYHLKSLNANAMHLNANIHNAFDPIFGFSFWLLQKGLTEIMQDRSLEQADRNQNFCRFCNWQKDLLLKMPVLFMSSFTIL